MANGTIMKKFRTTQFYSAFEKHVPGGGFANRGATTHLAGIKQALGWKENVYNKLVSDLRRDGTIQIFPRTHNVPLGYTDERGMQYGTIRWTGSKDKFKSAQKKRRK